MWKILKKIWNKFWKKYVDKYKEFKEDEISFVVEMLKFMFLYNLILLL